MPYKASIKLDFEKIIQYITFACNAKFLALHH